MILHVMRQISIFLNVIMNYQSMFLWRKRGSIKFR